MRLSQVGVSPGQLKAIFFTHMHSDHVDGFADIVQLRWHMNSPGPKIDEVCSSDAASVLGFTVSCRKFIAQLATLIYNRAKLPSAIPRTRNVHSAVPPS